VHANLTLICIHVINFRKLLLNILKILIWDEREREREREERTVDNGWGVMVVTRVGESPVGDPFYSRDAHLSH
jgi:hypothetical protein